MSTMPACVQKEVYPGWGEVVKMAEILGIAVYGMDIGEKLEGFRPEQKCCLE